MRRYSFYLVIFSFSLLILSGCGKLERKGTPPANSPPEVYFANIPSDSTYFSVNPKVYWFGTDVDGFVSAFQYAVLVRDSVVNFGELDDVKSFLYSIPPDSVSWVDQTTLKNMIGVHVQAEPGGHSRNVRMYADTLDTIYTPQYVFLRAVDNRGAVSEIISRMFYRNNHRPEAFIEVSDDFSTKNHYCLKDTTVTWKGITISWSGLDTADYPEERYQPDFQFKWELLGPFESSPTALTGDTTVVADSSLDSAFIAGSWLPTRWVTNESHMFKNLKNYGEDKGADAGYGWYQLRVRARDDAFVSTDTATKLNFRIIKPRFRYTDQSKKTVLMVDATSYGGQPGGVSGDSAESLVRSFYREALSFVHDQNVFDYFGTWNTSRPSEDTLSRYDLVVAVNVGSKSGISTDNYKLYTDYMDIGGRLWIIGMNNFNAPTGRGSKAAPEVAVEYFGLDEIFVAGWTSLDSMTLEFMRANPFGLWERLPTLEVEPEKCTKLLEYSDTATVFNFGVRGIPRVNYDALSNSQDYAFRIPAQRRIYSFVSYYGIISPMHDRPCAINYIGPTFRTVEFCFPLNLMKNESPDYPVFEVTHEMINWLLTDLP
jgi:hypothetical protein